MSLINFTVHYDLFAFRGDDVDDGPDADPVALIGPVTFTPQVADERPFIAAEYEPRPTGIKLLAIEGYLDVDGRLKSERGGTVGVRLPASDPVLNLPSPLNYRVSFSVCTPEGDPVPVRGGYFQAPSTDVEVNLASALEPTGSPVVGLTRRSGYAEDIVDSGSFGRSVVRSEDQADFWAVAGTVPSQNLPSYVDDVLEFNNYAAFPATGEAGKIYLAKDTGDSYRWSGSAYVRIGLASAADGSGLTNLADGQTVGVSGGKLVNHNPLYIDPTMPPYNVRMDRRTLRDVSIAAGSNQLTARLYTFVAADVGKVIKIVGAGAGGGSLKTTITGVSAGKAVLADAASTTIPEGYGIAFTVFGTDNGAALNQLFRDLSYPNPGDRSNNAALNAKPSRVAVFPHGAALYSGTLIFPCIGTVMGSAQNWAMPDLAYAPSRNAEIWGNTVFHQLWDQNVDCARVMTLDPDGAGLHQWSGKLFGFTIIQDQENTSGRGLSFRNSVGEPVLVPDGGFVDCIQVIGACNEGFEFPGGTLKARLSDLVPFQCGYGGRKLFTADMTAGSRTLTNISNTDNLAWNDMLMGAGVQPDTVIESVDTVAKTAVMSTTATATATGVTIQRAGDPGIKFIVSANTKTVEFDGCSGGGNSGGMLRIEGDGGSKSAVLITNCKSEYEINHYRSPRNSQGWSGVESGNDFPQGPNCVVLHKLSGSAVHVRGLSNHAASTSSVGGETPNTMGKPIGAAILHLSPLSNTQTAEVTWESVHVSFAPGSGQTTGYVYREAIGYPSQPFAVPTNGSPTGAVSGGSNRVRPRPLRSMVDQTGYLFTSNDADVQWTTLTGSRTGTLPALSSVVPGHMIRFIDASGNASPTRTITAVPAGSDTISGKTLVDAPYGMVSWISTGTKWVGFGSLPSPESTANRGQPDGYAPLNSSGKIDASYLPSSAMEWRGVWDAATNTPTLADGTGNAGDVYRVSIAGTRNLGSGLVGYGVGDLVIYDGSVWQRSDSTDAVSSVNGQTGTVTLSKADLGLGSVDNTADTAKPVSTATQTALDAKANAANPSLTGAAKVAQSGSVEVYNTADQTTNVEKLIARWTSNVAEIGTLFAGTGTTYRTLRFGVAAAAAGTLTRLFEIAVGLPFWKFAANTSAAGSAMQVTSPSGFPYNGASGDQSMLTIDPTMSQSGTAGYTMLRINPTESSTGSGTKRLADLAVGGVSKFTVDNTGTVSISGTTATARAGTGSPEGVVTAAAGSMYLRTDGGAGTTLYIKESGTGNTGWAAK